MDRNPEQIDQQEETGVSEGDARGNSPDAPGFTDAHDRLFRSHFQHANRLQDRIYEDVRPAYALGLRASYDTTGDQRFEEIEKDLEAGWLNVRTGTGDWTSVRDLAKEGFEGGRRLGYVDDAPPLGDSKRGQRPTYSDPVADGIDPTSPESPEQNY
jgi:hypothetical protein